MSDLLRSQLVYAIECGKHLKIGVAADPFRRARILQTAHVDFVKVLAFWSPEICAEAIAHHELIRWHVRGEWFQNVDSVRRRCDRWWRMQLHVKPFWREVLEDRVARHREMFEASLRIGRPLRPGDRTDLLFEREAPQSDTP